MFRPRKEAKMALKSVSGLWKRDKGEGYSGKTDAPIPAGARLYLFKADQSKYKQNPPDLVLKVQADEASQETGGDGEDFF
jgi:hypothetical protein